MTDRLMRRAEGVREMHWVEMTKPALQSGLCNNKGTDEAQGPMPIGARSNMSNTAAVIKSAQPISDEQRTPVVTSDFDFYNGLVSLFRHGNALVPSGVAVCVCVRGGPDGNNSVEFMGSFRRGGLKGLHRVFGGRPTLGWRTVGGQLYELSSINKLVDLLVKEERNEK